MLIDSPHIELLSAVDESGDIQIRRVLGKTREELPYRLRAADRNDGDALAFEVPTPARRERLERDLVAQPFDEHDRTRVACTLERSCRCVWTARQRLEAVARPRMPRSAIADVLFAEAHRVVPHSDDRV